MNVESVGLGASSRFDEMSTMIDPLGRTARWARYTVCRTRSIACRMRKTQPCGSA